MNAYPMEGQNSSLKDYVAITSKNQILLLESILLYQHKKHMHNHQ